MKNRSPSSTKLSFSTGNQEVMSKKIFAKYIDFAELIRTKNTLESRLLKFPEFIEGLNWGVPRFGHPEGKVGFHVIEVLDNIENLQVDPQTLQKLRITAIAHDTFKNKESESIVRGSRTNHGLLARRFMEDHIEDEETLDLIELHDEIYYSWRHEALQHNPEKAERRLGNLLRRIGDHLKLHYLFFRCDTLTGDKIQAPRFWFERKLIKTGGADMAKLIERLEAQ